MKPGNNQYLEETKSFKLIRNRFAYSYWDLQSVADHIMIVPKKHTDTLNNMSSEEAVEFMGILGSYESRGYNIWAQAPQSKTKTVVHQHTHLIKPGKKTYKFLFYLKRPYLRFIK
jgi:diadenosine tetraphosphate (Ap4A) HIT family hydrolase